MTTTIGLGQSTTTSLDHLACAPADKGRSRLKAMLGATDWGVWKDSDGENVRFRFKGCRKYSICQLTLAWDDTYTLTLTDKLARNYERIVGLYAEDLAPTFTRLTRLDTHL